MGTVSQTRIPIVAYQDSPVAGVPPRRFTWGAVFAGGIAGLGVWILLYALGLALGFTVLDADNPSTLRPSSLFAGWWSVITPLPALFVGGLVAGRSIGVATRGLGAVHGLVLWGMTTVVGVWLVANVFTAVVDRAATASALIAAQKGIEALAPEPEATAAAPTATAAAPTTAGSAEPTTAAETEPTAEKAAVAARDGALEAADAVGNAFYGIFGALLLGMIAAMAGAATGVTRRQVAWADAPLGFGIAPPMTVAGPPAGGSIGDLDDDLPPTSGSTRRRR